MVKKPRVPEVLWRLFRNRARTLAHTIIYLIPPRSLLVECRCKGRRCLGCRGAEAMEFLLRPDDPPDYRKLLKKCFVVVSDTAPPVEVFNPECQLSVKQIVRKTIERMRYEQPGSSNIICCGYDESIRWSSIVELLSSSAWALLLNRVGDGLMGHLLAYTSIFLPSTQKVQHQVAGPPISDFCHEFLKMSESKGPQKKRKRVDEVNPTLEIQRSEKQLIQMTLSEAPMPMSGTVHTTENPRKRVRQFSWQRHKKHRHYSFQEANVLTPCTIMHTDNACVSGRLQCRFNTSSTHHREKIPQLCSCCLILQATQKVNKGAEINRKHLFYKLERSSSVFPRSHVLSFLKPNFKGANDLFADIFGSSTNGSPQCFHSSAFCLNGSSCPIWIRGRRLAVLRCARDFMFSKSVNLLEDKLIIQYHSLVKLIKILIRRARCCQHLKLLDKHCAVSPLDNSANGNASYMTGGNESETKALKRGRGGTHLKGNLQVEKSHNFDTRKERTLEAIDSQFEPNMSHCLKSQVVSFVWAVCRSIVPPDLLGTPCNWRILRRNISRFIGLRRYEKFSLRQCMHKLKTSRFSLLSRKHCVCYFSNNMTDHATGQTVDMRKECCKLNDASYAIKHQLFKSWIFYFFSSLVVPLVQANFYVTESEHGNQEVIYYRKSVWERLASSSITCLKYQNYRYLDNASVRNIISKRSFGFSKLRLRPKENGVRVLANLKASSRMPSPGFPQKDKSCRVPNKTGLQQKRIKFEHYKSVNSVLRELHAVLKGLQMKNPEKLGSSVFDYNSVYRKLCPFLSGLKNGSTVMPPLFIVVADVSQAFDSIDQDKLLSVMKNVILQDEYFLKRFQQVVCTKRCLWVHGNLMSRDSCIRNGATKFTSSAPFRSLNSVLVDQDWNRSVHKKELFFNLTEHVKRNVLQLHKIFYLQEVGIPQGSVVSSLLCSFYYGDLERKVIFPFLEKACEPSSKDLSCKLSCHGPCAAQNSGEDGMIATSPRYMLLRFIDDFIFISTSKEQSAGLFSRLQRGFREYNCFMNKEKFSLNFDTHHVSEFPSNRVYVGEDGISFLRWSGLFINGRTLEVQADYTRYLNNHLSSTLTVCWEDKPGHRLREKLCDFMRPKCHPIFYDSNINSAAIVRLNIYQAFLLCAMKFHCYVCDLSYVCNLHREFSCDIIERSFRYVYRLIKKRMISFNLSSNLRPVLQLKKREVQWIGLKAYIRVLKRKQSRHKELLSLLRFKLLAHTKSQVVSSELEYAVDDSHSCLLWKIKY